MTHDVTRSNRNVWTTVILGLQLVSSRAFAQADMSAFTDPLMGVLRFIVDYVGPAVAIGGLIFAGAQFISGETGRPFKVALSVVVGGVLIASAENLWTTFFSGTAVGG